MEIVSLKPGEKMVIDTPDGPITLTNNGVDGRGIISAEVSKYEPNMDKQEQQVTFLERIKRAVDYVLTGEMPIEVDAQAKEQAAQILAQAEEQATQIIAKEEGKVAEIREQVAQILAQAKEQAAQIIEQAKEQATQIVNRAKQEENAQQLTKGLSEAFKTGGGFGVINRGTSTRTGGDTQDEGGPGGNR